MPLNMKISENINETTTHLKFWYIYIYIYMIIKHSFLIMEAHTAR